MKRSVLAVSMFCVLAAMGAQGRSDHPEPPPLALAANYSADISAQGLWASEKMDGVRAYWDGRHLLSRQGHVYHAPTWFTAGFPAQPLDGELWLGRGTFELLMRTVRDGVPDQDAWRSVRFWVFDLPAASGTFENRQVELKQLLEAGNAPYLRVVEHWRLETPSALQALFADVTSSGGEGLMLRRGDAHYRAGRNTSVLKHKPYADAEATVIAHAPGKGKYAGMTGALVVLDSAGRRFKLGSGLSDAQRRAPPPIGSEVSYRFQGFTGSGKPRFARFLRQRSEE